MHPYYNSGVVLSPWDCDLGTMWTHHIRTIADLFTQEDEASPWVRQSDQAGLATAIVNSQRQGVRFVRLPLAYHTLRADLFQGAIRLAEIKLFHACRFGHKCNTDKNAIRRAPRRYQKKFAKYMKRIWAMQDEQQPCSEEAARRRETSLIDNDALAQMLDGLFQRHIAPVIRKCGE